MKKYWTPSDMMRPDADILLALQHFRRAFTPASFTCTHIYGHQVTRTRDTDRYTLDTDDSSTGPDSDEKEASIALPRPSASNQPLSVQLNIESDRKASETSDIFVNVAPDTSQLPPTIWHHLLRDHEHYYVWDPLGLRHNYRSTYWMLILNRGSSIIAWQSTIGPKRLLTLSTGPPFSLSDAD